MQDPQGAPKPDSANGEWITADELAKRLRVSKSTIYRAARANKIKSKKEGTKLYLQYDPVIAAAFVGKHEQLETSHFFSHLVRKVHNHPWFTLLAGLSSILGLVIAIYAIWPTKVSPPWVNSIANKNSSSPSSPQPTPASLGAVAGEKDQSSVVGDTYKVPLGNYVPGKYRVRYIVFHGRSFLHGKSPIFGLLNGSVKENTYDLFNHEPYVLKTEPLVAFERLSRRFPEFYNDEQNLWIASSTLSTNRIQRAFSEDPHYYIVTPDDELEHNESGEGAHHTERAFGLIGSNNIQHLAGDYPAIPPPVLDLIANNPELPDVAMEQLSFGECDGDWTLEFQWRPFKMLVLDIENLDSQPLEITSVRGRLFRFPDLHLYPWEDAPKGGVEEQYEFPIRALAPGEHILVPIRLILASFGDFDSALHPESLPPTIPPTAIPEVNLENGVTFNLHCPDKQRASQVHNEYILGTAFVPTFLRGIGEIRQFSRQHLVYHGPLEMGSCPFAFVFDERLMRWVNVGALIPNRDGKDKEGEDSLPIHYPYNGTILVKEVEKEVSFLDQVYLKVETWDGRTLVVYPRDHLLQRNDSSYVILKRGDQILVKFINLPTNVRQIHLISRGYFLRNLN
jgi:excisionase family DNA binding protein